MTQHRSDRDRSPARSARRRLRAPAPPVGTETAPQRLRPDLIERLARAQAERAQQSLLRRLRSVDAVDDACIVIDGRRLANFASNDYLGLAQHPAVTEALMRAATTWGVGASAAHLLGGHRDAHARLERELARWTGRERALLFSTGFMANLGVLQALFGPSRPSMASGALGLLPGGAARGDAASRASVGVCVQDKLNHASLLDAAQFAGVELKRYVHADVGSAQRQLAARPDMPALLATDGVFSMDGDVAPLAGLAAECARQQATLMVDDAHGLGVLGPDGSGSVAEAGLGADAVPVLMGTLGKALGVSGAFVAGSDALIEGLVQFARPHIYTTAMPPALAAAASVAVDVARFEDWRRRKLDRLIAHFRHGADRRGIALLASRTPIQPVVVGASADAQAAARALEAQGFFVPAIRPPTVPQGKARLRVVINARHEEADVECLLDALARVLGALPQPA